MRTDHVSDLLGEDLARSPLGEDRLGSLIGGFIPERSLVHVAPMQLGDGLAGPANDQQLQIYRDARPLAVDELGMEGPFAGEKLARHRAGRQFPLNYSWIIVPPLPGVIPQQEARQLSPLDPGQNPDAHEGFPATEVIPSPYSVYYTASPNVGWPGYR